MFFWDCPCLPHAFPCLPWDLPRSTCDRLCIPRDPCAPCDQSHILWDIPVALVVIPASLRSTPASLRIVPASLLPIPASPVTILTSLGTIPTSFGTIPTTLGTTPASLLCIPASPSQPHGATPALHAPPLGAAATPVPMNQPQIPTAQHLPMPQAFGNRPPRPTAAPTAPAPTARPAAETTKAIFPPRSPELPGPANKKKIIRTWKIL